MNNTDLRGVVDSLIKTVDCGTIEPRHEVAQIST